MTPSDHIDAWQRVQHEKRRKPTIITARRTKQGFWIPAQSSCCHAGIVYFDGERFVPWTGYPNEDVPDELRCRRCNLKIAK